MKSKYKTYGNNINLYNIEDIIKNILKNYNIYSSTIIIYEYPKAIVVKFSIYIGYKKQYKIIKSIIKYIKSLLVLRYNKNVQLNVNISRDMYKDNEILGEIIKDKINKNKNKIINILKSVHGNKIKNNR